MNDNNITRITESITRVVVPFEDIYTTIFVVSTPDGVLLFDTATYPEDIDNYALPTFEKLGIAADEVKYVFISHSHRDHAGGLDRFAELFPKTCIVSLSAQLRGKYPNAETLAPNDGDTLLGVLKVVTVPGHSADCISLYDTRTKTLLTGDCLQAYGIYGSGSWGANIGMPLEHLAALDKLRTYDVETLVTSHDYHPCGHIAVGKDEIERYYSECANALYAIRDAVKASYDKPDADIAAAYNDGSLPVVGARIFTGIRKAMDAGKM